MARPDRRRWSATGLGGVLVTFFGLGALYAFTVPKFLPADETSHVGYALTLAHGDLPELDSPVPEEVPGMATYFELRREIYTANHPPLYYVLVATPLGLGVRWGHPVMGMELARLLTVALTAVAACAVWWTARTLTPGRPDVALLAAAIAVLLPAVPRFAGVVYNDGFALAVAAVALAVSVRLLVHGPTRRLLVAALVAAAALSLTRAVGISAVGLVGCATSGSIMLHDQRPWRARTARAAAAALAIGAAAFVASGWFWIRSQQLYGDIAGSAYNLHRFGYGRRGSTLAMVTDLHWPSVLYRQIWGRIYDDGEYAVGWGALPGIVFAGLVALGALALVIRLARGQEAPTVDRLRAASVVDRGRAAAWILLVVWCALIYVSTMGYIASGGGAHGRYLFPGIPAVALLAATAIGALPGRRWALGPVLSVGLLVTVGLLWAAKFADTLRPDAHWWGDAMTSTAAVANGIPTAFVWLAVIAAVFGAATLCTSMVALAKSACEQTEVLSAPRPRDGRDRR